MGYQNSTQYNTFRVVSTQRTVPTKGGGSKTVGSSPNSWIHPGLSPNPVMAAVYAYCIPQVEKNLRLIAEKAFGIGK
jgi:hypothetical protein